MQIVRDFIFIRIKLKLNKIIEKLNRLGKDGIPFFFVVDYSTNESYVSSIENLDEDIYFDIDGFSNKNKNKNKLLDKKYSKKTIDYDKYEKAFYNVIDEIKKGNTYLLNLTFPTKVKTNLSLLDIFSFSEAKFSLYFKNKFTVFSPERFIKIENNKISTNPMKGTIDASIKNGKDIILNDEKEKAEHVMIVDLLRNDLSMVSKKVRVEKFRYIDEIKAGDKKLYQVSSKISGELDLNWKQNIGNILFKLLPAGSISGTPKSSSIKIIKETEGYERGFYTGIFGYFDGENFDSAVSIRYIEKDNENFIYKSGGGITIDSNCKKEYNELIDKVYLQGFKEIEYE